MSVSFDSWDLHQPWGSLRVQAPGGWVHWPACDWVVPRTDSGSGDCASSSAVSYRGGDEETIGDLAKVLNYRPINLSP